MAYQKTNWENLPSKNTPINAANLNKMEEGIAKAVEKTGDIMTGGLYMQGNPIGFGSGGNIFFKEDGFGDKFRIVPNFNGAGSDNKLILQSTIGDAGEDPQNWKDLVYIHADSGEVELAGDIGTKNQIVYGSWHNVILTRSDQSWLTLILYGSNLLKKGNYSIANDFKLTAYGTSYAELTIPRSAIKEINRKDWGFELIVARSEIQGNVSGELNGVAIAHDGNLVLQST